MSEACYDDSQPCELAHFNFADDHDLVVILKLLDKVRDGFFQVVLILPPASSWSRARHVGPEGQPPIRSRSRPWGVIEASSAQYSKLLHDNRTAEISTWFAEQSLLREEPRTALIYIFPEDFGGHFSTGPASLWSLQELRVLHGTHDALRGATFLCRICGSDRKKPLGILTNLPGLQEALSLGLPNLKMQRVFSSVPRTIAEIMRLFAASPTQCRNFFLSWISHGRALWCALLEILFFWSTESAGFQPRYGWRQCGLTGCHGYSDFLSFLSRRVLDRSLQSLATQETHQEVPARLHGITRPGLIFYWYAPGSDGLFRRCCSLCVAEFDCSFLFIESDEIDLAIHRYFFTTFWSYGRSPDALGVEGGRRWQWRFAASCGRFS